MVPLIPAGCRARLAIAWRSTPAFLCAASLGLAALGAVSARAATIGIDLYGLSHHFARRDEAGGRFNELNVGAGIDCVLLRTASQTAFADLSIYRDSFRSPNRYLSIAWTHRVVGDLQAGGMLVVSSSHSVNLAEPFMAPVPMLSYRTDRAAVQVVYIPQSDLLSYYPSVAAFATGYPFGAARARPRSATADRAGPGIEFSLGPRLTLERFDGAEIALRGRSGTRGWRLGLDLGALIGETRSDTVGPIRSGVRTSSETYDLRLSAQRTFHGPARHGASMLTGVGPTLGYANEDPLTELRTWRVGAVGSLGVEWRTGPALSLLAEYGWDLTATIGRGEFGTLTRQTTIREERYAFTARGARVGVTLWPGRAP